MMVTRTAYRTVVVMIVMALIVKTAQVAAATARWWWRWRGRWRPLHGRERQGSTCWSQSRPPRRYHLSHTVASLPAHSVALHNSLNRVFFAQTAWSSLTHAPLNFTIPTTAYRFQLLIF